MNGITETKNKTIPPTLKQSQINVKVGTPYSNQPLTIQFNHGQRRHPPKTSTTTTSTLNYKPNNPLLSNEIRNKVHLNCNGRIRSRTVRRRYTSTRLGYNHSVMPVNCVINDERGYGGGGYVWIVKEDYIIKRTVHH